MSTPNTDVWTRPARGVIQGAIAEGGIRLTTIVPDPDLQIDSGDRALLLIVVTAAVSALMNFVENRLGTGLLKNVPEEPIAADA